MLVCAHTHPCSALSTSYHRNYLSQTPLPSPFLVGLANRRHWPKMENKRRVLLSFCRLQAVFLAVVVSHPWAQILLGSSSQSGATSPARLHCGSRSCQRACLLGSGNTIFSLSLQPWDGQRILPDAAWSMVSFLSRAAPQLSCPLWNWFFAFGSFRLKHLEYFCFLARLPT